MEGQQVQQALVLRELHPGAKPEAGSGCAETATYHYGQVGKFPESSSSHM